MAIPASDFNYYISPNPVSTVVGKTSDITMHFSNTSLTEWAYNLSIEIQLPDGVSFVSSLIPPTSITKDPSGKIILKWLNLKDLAPSEIDYNFSIKVKGDEVFRVGGNIVPFDIPISAINTTATIDTMPRGNDDIGNVVITKNSSANFIPLRYAIKKTAPEKMTKGAGTLSPVASPRWPYTYTLTVTNNSREASNISLVDNLPNGVRYLNNLKVSGPDSGVLSSPVVTVPSNIPGCQNFVNINWGSVTVSANSENIITFEAAIWDNFTNGCQENSGSRIVHQTPLTNTATLDGLSGPVVATAKTNALDLEINKGINSGTTDVGGISTYTLTYMVNQYDNMNNVVITDTLPDGKRYNVGSASVAPDSVVVNADGTTTIIWNLNTLAASSSGIITFTATTKTLYADGSPVDSDDIFLNNVLIDGTNSNFGTKAPDASSARSNIAVPSIKKELLNYYYSDGTVKSIDAAAPGDLVEFKITYDASNITAEQRNIEIDEFAPLNLGPLDSSLPVIYGGNVAGPFNPITISPNGLRWALGNLPGKSVWSATFKIPVENVSYMGSAENLAKLSGQSIDDISYSYRDQVNVDFGRPNISMTKTVSGPNVKAIKAGEIYSYTVTIKNNLDLAKIVTDAFEMNFIDTIPDNLQLNGIFAISGSGTHSTPDINGNTISMVVNKLAPGQSITLTYEVRVTTDVVSGKTYNNNAVLQRPYSQPNKSYQYPGNPFKATAALKAQGITIIKTISPVFAKIGDTATYILETTVPLGTKAYNVTVSDSFPSANQSYLSNSAALNGNPITPTVSGGTVTFPTIPVVDATTKAVTLSYSFDVRITSASQLPPYSENQTDNAYANWDLDVYGTKAPTFSTKKDLQVRVPFLASNKQQRNVTQSGAFTNNQISYNVGDIIEYRISVTNSGLAPAYITVLEDNLNQYLGYIPASAVVTSGSVTESANLLTWNIPQIQAGATETITFQVITNVGVGSGDIVPNGAALNYNSNNNGFGTQYGPVTTNTVYATSQILTIQKVPSIDTAKIGDDIVYTVTIKVPSGTVAYDFYFNDVLDQNQDYIGPSTLQILPNSPVPVVPSVAGKNLTYPTIGNIDASSGEVTVIYTFVARVTDSPQISPYNQVQVNESYANWKKSSGGSYTNALSLAYVDVKTPYITILKQQKNFTKEPSAVYATSPIIGSPGDVIYYRFTINSSGGSPAYNINLGDVLSSKLSYVGVISGPTTGSIIPPSPPQNNLVWNVPVLNNGDTAEVIVAVSINNGIGAGDSIDNSINATYDSNTVNPKTYEQVGNKVTINIPSLEITKTASPDNPSIGDVVTYTITIPVPSGVTAFDMVIADLLPANQSYVAGSWNGSTPGVPVVNGSLIEYTLPVNPLGPATLIYNFQATIDTGTSVPPFTEVQTNYSGVSWRYVQGGELLVKAASVDVVVTTPNLIIVKKQRNFSAGDVDYTTTPLKDVMVNDLIDYSVTITNSGKNTAYNIITTDVLSQYLQYIGEIPPFVLGTVVENPQGTITWTEASLLPNTSVTLFFRVQALAGGPPNLYISNSTNTTYKTTPTTPTTIGPRPSNVVAFNYNNLEIYKTSDKDSGIIGDTINYTVEVIVPYGNVAYDIVVTDNIPPTQAYVVGSGVPTPTSVVGGLITFPTVPSVDATGGEVILTYEFSTTIDSIITSPQDVQTNGATVNWNIVPGTPGVPQSTTKDIYATNIAPTIVKSQRNYTQDTPITFTTNPVDANIGDIIYYQVEINNTSMTDSIYNVNITDVLDQNLKFSAIISQPQNGQIIVSTNNGVETVSGIIPSIPPNTTYSFVFAATVISGGAQGYIPNSSNFVFNVNQLTPSVVYGAINSNEVQLTLPNLTAQKTAPTIPLEIGSIIEYTINVTIPSGTTAYNLVLTDTLPPEQIYIGEATINGITDYPVQSGANIIFSPKTFTAGSSDLIVPYIFKARIVEGNGTSPYTMLQNNVATINWEIDRLGTKAEPIDTNANVTVISPDYYITKYQSNITKGTGFIIDDLSVSTGDIIEFALVANNVGAANCYNVITTDLIDTAFEFLGVVDISNGSYNFDSATNIFTWTVAEIQPATFEYIIAQFRVLSGFSAGDIKNNSAISFIDTNTTTPITLGGYNSNTVNQIFPNVGITKTSNIDNATIGDIITYTIVFTVPNGTQVYNAVVTDTLPVGQVYNNNAKLNGKPITASSPDNINIVFPTIPYAQATDGDLNFVYTFEAIVNSIVTDGENIEYVQRNEAVANWLIGVGNPGIGVNATENIQVTTNNINVIKKQRNMSASSKFTTDSIIATDQSIIEYSLEVINTGTAPVYDVEITDNLSNMQSFVQSIDVPIGTLVHSGEAIGGVVTWNVPVLNPGESYTAVFSIKVMKGVSNTIPNSTTQTFKNSPQALISFTAHPSNVVLIKLIGASRGLPFMF